MKKSHTFTATDDCGLACFTNDNDYIIECTFIINTNNGSVYSVDFDLNVDIYTSETFPGYGVNGVDYLNFGEYPQTKLQNQDTLSSLTDTGEFFSTDDSSNVNSIFLDDNNNRYVKVDFCSDTGEPGYFLIEPIKWYILNQENGQTFLQSSVIVDAVAFMKDYYVTSEGLILACDEDGNIITPNANEGDGEYIYVNNYKYSNLRSYFNNIFYSQAFTNYEKLLINKTMVKNDITTINTEYAKEIKQYICPNTEDYVFSLSYQDLTNINYGYSIDPEALDINRIVKASEYAKSVEGNIFAIEDYALGTIADYTDIPSTKAGIVEFLVTNKYFSTTEKATSFYNEFIINMSDWWLRSPAYDSDDSMWGNDDFAFSIGLNYCSFMRNSVAHSIEANNRYGCVPSMYINL